MIGSQGSETRTYWKRKASFIALLCLLTFPGCAGSKERNVVVIARTNTYHRENCARVRMAHTRTMTVEEARALNFEPCPGCHPDSDL